MQPYPRPEVNVEHQLKAVALASQLTSNRSTAQLRKAVAGLLCENMRLALEVNEHRAARGFEPLPTVEQS